MLLTDKTVKAAKPTEKQYKLPDGRGLFLLVLPTGGKYWHFRSKVGGKERLISFGTYPETTLSEARDKRETARKQLANGIDPSELRKAQKAANLSESADTFEAVSREWYFKFKSQWTENHAGRIMTRLEQDVFPFIGVKPIGEIKAPDLLAVLRRIEPRTLEGAHRVKTACGQIFRYAIATGRAERDLSADLRGAMPTVKNNHMAAPTDPKDVAPILRSIDGFTGQQFLHGRLFDIAFLGDHMVKRCDQCIHIGECGGDGFLFRKSGECDYIFCQFRSVDLWHPTSNGNGFSKG
jgi:hypothetical protein